MKRLGIVVLFDKSGCIDRYIDYLLSSIKVLFYKLVIVINGSIEEKDLIKLKRYTQNLFIRENKGFDAGAYKDVLLKFISREEWFEYDEITLMNDTFYGPFYPLRDMWDAFDETEVDFWGITRHPDGQAIPHHIQAYFLTIRKRMLQSREFLIFWETMPELKDVADAIREFEVRFTTFFEERGFAWKTLMDRGHSSIQMQYNENPYLTCNLYLIRDKKIPFLKKKSLQMGLSSYEDTLDTVKYIEKEKLYDTAFIWENIFRLSKEKQFHSVFNYAKLEDFYFKHHRIFIYGAGKYGQKIKRYFAYRKWSYVCFLVSKDEDVGDNCVKYDSTMILPSDGIIMALNNRNLEEVLSGIMGEISPEQLLLPENLL